MAIQRVRRPRLNPTHHAAPVLTRAQPDKAALIREALDRLTLAPAPARKRIRHSRRLSRNVGEILEPMVNAAWCIRRRDPALGDAILQALLCTLYLWRGGLPEAKGGGRLINLSTLSLPSVHSERNRVPRISR